MDPNTAYDAMLAAMTAGDWQTAREHAEALRDWLLRGGFGPDRPNAGDWTLTVLRHDEPDGIADAPVCWLLAVRQFGIDTANRMYPQN